MDLLERRAKAEGFFRGRYGYLHEEISDFGSYCVEHWCQGKRIETAFELLAIDYLRQYVHNDRGTVDLVLRSTRVEETEEVRVFKTIPKQSPDIARFESGSVFRAGFLSAEQRTVMILSQEWGFTQLEIADVLGKDPSWVWVLHKEAIEILKRKGDFK